MFTQAILLSVFECNSLYNTFNQSNCQSDNFFKGCPGQGANLESLDFRFFFSINCSALDYSATAPPSVGVVCRVIIC